MERMERLYLLLAYGFGSLAIGFLTILLLAFSYFPFMPGSVVAVAMTIGIFALSFFLSAKIVSKYMTFSGNDVRFLVNLALSVGLLLIAVDVVWDGTKISTLLSNLSFLTAFVVCTGKFLKPKDEVVVIEAQQQVIAAVTPIIQFSIKIAKASYRQAVYLWRNFRARYGQHASSETV